MFIPRSPSAARQTRWTILTVRFWSRDWCIPPFVHSIEPGPLCAPIPDVQPNCRRAQSRRPWTRDYRQSLNPSSALVGTLWLIRGFAVSWGSTTLLLQHLHDLKLSAAMLCWHHSDSGSSPWSDCARDPTVEELPVEILLLGLHGLLQFVLVRPQVSKPLRHAARGVVGNAHPHVAAPIDALKQQGPCGISVLVPAGRPVDIPPMTRERTPPEANFSIRHLCWPLGHHRHIRFGRRDDSAGSLGGRARRRPMFPLAQWPQLVRLRRPELGDDRHLSTPASFKFGGRITSPLLGSGLIEAGRR